MTPTGDKQAQASSKRDSRVGEAWGAALTRDTSIYVGGAVIGFVLALVSIAVVTRFLTPAEFGQLALLLVFAAFLTIFYNVGTLQGTFMWVFGSAGEEDIEDDGESSEAGTKRRALGTGLLITTGICLIGTAVVVPLSPTLANMTLNDSSKWNLIVIAAVSGAAGAIWRLVSNVLRMERKPKRYVALNSVRPVLVVGCVIILVAAGGGVEGAILGTALGSVLSIVVGLVVTRRSYKFVFDRAHATMILRRGGIYVPIIISIWIAQNVDIYALSYFTSDDQVVGLYRLAGRYGAFLDYFTAALFMAWTPLVQTSTFQAALARSGREQLGGSLLTVFTLAGLFLILAMTAAADALVRIAPSEYAAAAPLIPLLGVAFLSYGMFISVYRLSAFPKKRAAYIGTAILSAVGFLASAPLLVPLFGAYGAALAVIFGFVVGGTGLTYLSQRGPNPLEIEYGRIAAGLALAGVCIAIARVLGPLSGSWDPAVEWLAVALYTVGLFVTGIVGDEDRQAVGRVLHQVLPQSLWRAPDVEQRLRALPAEQASALEAIVLRGAPIDRLAEAGSRNGSAETRLISLLDGIAGEPPARLKPPEEGEDASEGEDAPEGEAAPEGPPPDQDQRIAAYLVSEMPVAEHDEMGRTLWGEGVDPEYLHALEEAVTGLRRLPKRVWAEVRRDGGAEHPGDGAGFGRLRLRRRRRAGAGSAT
jgi:O-antigen/teichoic acid export membrane protein